MSQQVVFIRKNGEPSEAVNPSQAMVVARMNVKTGEGPFRLERNGHEGPELARGEVLKRLNTAMRKGEIGTRLRVLDDQEDYVYKVRVVQPEPEVVDISGNHNADVYYSAVMDDFAEYHPRYAGSYVCKDIAGSWISSQHSYGNAVDFFFDSLAHQDEVANWAVAHADDLHIHTVISRSRIWTRDQGWHTYTGDYHSHLHVDFDPQYSGSCGVRG